MGVIIWIMAVVLWIMTDYLDHGLDLKGKLGEFFLLAQSFYRLQTKKSLKRQFSPKSA